MGEEKLENESKPDQQSRILITMPSSTDMRIAFQAQNVSAEQVLWVSRWLEREALKMLDMADMKRLQEQQRNQIQVARKGNGRGPNLNQIIGSKR